jgi:macrolide-specific efflux system membrane fusion protein
MAAGSGMASGNAPRGPRRATVKVATADGSIQEREVMVGISNRVHAEILSGLQEGERVVAGVKVPDAPKRNTAQNQGANALGQGPGGIPGAAGGGGNRR